MFGVLLANNLANSVELFVSCERIGSIVIDQEGSVTKMDNQQLNVVNRFSHRKFKYLGSFPADLRPRYLPTKTFCMINTDPSTKPVSHWILPANKSGTLFYGDSMGELLEKSGIRTKSNFVSIVQERLQDSLLSGL